MAGSKDRTIIRDAVLAGAVVAASCVTALIRADHSAPPRSQIAAVASGNQLDINRDPESRGVARARNAQAPATGVAPTPGSNSITGKKKSPDMTLVVMVPDLPQAESSAPAVKIPTDESVAAPLPEEGIVGGIAVAKTKAPSHRLTSLSGSRRASAPSNALIEAPLLARESRGTRPPSSTPELLRSQAGFVLLAGGQSGGKLAISSAQIYDPARREFVSASSMKDARANHTATWLPSGKILIAGGLDAHGGTLASAELYDPVTGAFLPERSALNNPRAKHTSTLISGCKCPADGKVLIAGGVSGAQGQTLRDAELYDPARQTFTPTGAMNVTRAMHTATLLASGPMAGDVLITGGSSDENGGEVASAELYDPVAGQFVGTGAMNTPRHGHSATWLSPKLVQGALAGGVLIAGGGESAAPADSAEVFDPQSGTFGSAGAMVAARTQHAAVLLDDGRVLIAGGQSGDNSFPVGAELFNPASATFTGSGSMIEAHPNAMATVLVDGSVLVTGGPSRSADLYDPAAGTFSRTGRMIYSAVESTSTRVR